MKAVGGSMPASARMSSTSTPSQAVSNFDHAVTQWMSRVILVCGSALNSAQVHFLTGRGPCLSVNVQSSVRTRGVGPAESTGKPWSRYWPGGMRASVSVGGFRPEEKPRVTIDTIRCCGSKSTAASVLEDIPAGNRKSWARGLAAIAFAEGGLRIIAVASDSGGNLHGLAVAPDIERFPGAPARRRRRHATGPSDPL